MANRGANFVDLSGTIAAGGAAQSLVGQNTARRYLRISNPSTAGESLWINDKGGTASSSDGKSWELQAGQIWEPDVPPTNAVSIVGATTGHAFEAAEG
jgi:hypothetical protein